VDGVRPAGGRLVKLADGGGELGLAAVVLGEEDDACRLAAGDEREQPGGRCGAGIAIDHPLAGQLSGAQLRQTGHGGGQSCGRVLLGAAASGQQGRGPGCGGDPGDGAPAAPAITRPAAKATRTTVGAGQP
jgi:hypothetical protein